MCVVTGKFKVFLISSYSKGPAQTGTWTLLWVLKGILYIQSDLESVCKEPEQT